MKTETYQELFQKVYGRMEDETYQEIADSIFSLAKEKDLSLYDAFRRVIWHEGHDIWLHLRKKYEEIKRTELAHLSAEDKKDTKYFIYDDDYRHLHHEIVRKLGDLFDEIVRKEWSKELEQKILKDQLEFYENWKKDSEKWLKIYQKKKDARRIETKKKFIQDLEEDYESIRQGKKIGNILFASAFMRKKANELYHRSA
ncbi:MAG: hypothetical protein ACTSRI_02045 [Promethearchaeota archaeon]